MTKLQAAVKLIALLNDFLRVEGWREEGDDYVFKARIKSDMSSFLNGYGEIVHGLAGVRLAATQTGFELDRQKRLRGGNEDAHGSQCG